MKSAISPLIWRDGKVVMLDQRLLPHEEIYNEYSAVGEVAEAISAMVVRGAPAIGVAAAYGIALAARTDGASLEEACDLLAATRPTAVNLFWAIRRMRGRIEEGADADDLLAEARSIHEEDLAACRAMGEHGAALVPDEAVILTHCNAGALATVGWGTALGVVRSAVEAGKKVRVVADETRPFLQGARLTAWELAKDGIDVTVISDGAAASLIARGEIDMVVVGTDRVAANGDVANKIGTYGVALAAHADQVPFYVAAPWSTIDMECPDGDAIPIEERPDEEVIYVMGSRILPEGVPVRNPAFDVTPFELITGLITERGVISPPFDEGLRRMSGGR